MNIEVRKNPSSADINFLTTGLKEFNQEFGTEALINPMCIFAQEESGKRLGGALCKMQYTSCYIHLFWIEPGARGRGLGRAVFEALVQECKRAGIQDMFLDTFSFQNCGFYQRLGFKSVGCLTNYPRQGINKLFYHLAIS